MSYGMLIVLYQMYSEQSAGSDDFVLSTGEDFLLSDMSNFLLSGNL